MTCHAPRWFSSILRSFHPAPEMNGYAIRLEHCSMDAACRLSRWPAGGSAPGPDARPTRLERRSAAPARQLPVTGHSSNSANVGGGRTANPPTARDDSPHGPLSRARVALGADRGFRSLTRSAAPDEYRSPSRPSQVYARVRGNPTQICGLPADLASESLGGKSGALSRARLDAGANWYLHSRTRSTAPDEHHSLGTPDQVHGRIRGVSNLCTAGRDTEAGLRTGSLSAPTPRRQRDAGDEPTRGQPAESSAPRSLDRQRSQQPANRRISLDATARRALRGTNCEPSADVSPRPAQPRRPVQAPWRLDVPRLAGAVPHD
jgi:hypothetical protein